jgi:copper chaperone CopZ
MTTDAEHQSKYSVPGIVCANCVGFVTDGLMGIPGVTDVRVELEAGRVTVSSDRELRREEVSAALEEAGYRLAAG